MPLPTFLCIALASGIATALAGRGELRLSPRHAFLTTAFAAFLVFASLVLVPAGVYFYVFHGDWFLLYLFDVQRIPSAVALVGFVLQVGLGALGFSIGAALLRSQRETFAGVLIALAVVTGGAVPVVLRDRLAVAGTFAQYEGHFGLTPIADSPLFLGGVTMAAIVVVGLTFLLVRLNMASARG
ncbi:MAG: hypothetical protein U0234_00935 [Sandaracinus sp.]